MLVIAGPLHMHTLLEFSCGADLGTPVSSETERARARKKAHKQTDPSLEADNAHSPSCGYLMFVQACKCVRTHKRLKTENLAPVGEAFCLPEAWRTALMCPCPSPLHASCSWIHPLISCMMRIGMDSPAAFLLTLCIHRCGKTTRAVVKEMASSQVSMSTRLLRSRARMPRVSAVGGLLRPYLSCIRCLPQGLGGRGQTPPKTGTVG